MGDLGKLADSMTGVGGNIRKNVSTALGVTAGRIKEDWSDAAGKTGLKAYARSIDYDVSEGVTKIEAEIGPNPDKKQGVLGAVEDAEGRWKSSPQHAGRNALEANEDDFYEGLAQAAVDSLLDGLP